MKSAKVGLGVGLGAGALVSAGYASAVGLARRPASPFASDAEIAAIVDGWLGRLGVVGAHHFIGTEVGRIHALEVGEGAHPLVFLHGVGASVGEYASLIAKLSTNNRVIAIDRPGSGLSDPISFKRHPRSAWNLAVNAVIEALGIGTFELVGHSLGGLAAGGFAIDHPASVKHLVLLSPVGISPRLPPLWNLSMLPGITDIMGAAARLAMDRQRREDRATAVGAGWGPVRIGPELAQYRYLVGTRFARGSDLETIPRLMRPFGFLPESLLLPGLDSLANRTLILWGNRDDQVALAPARRELASHPGVTLQVISGAGHLFPFAEPVSTASLIAEWCRKG